MCTKKPISSVEMKDIIEETGFSHGVVYSDMLAMTDPERAMNIARRLGKDEQSPLLYATVATEKFLKDVVKHNKLKPASSVDEIIQFMIVNYHGIQTGYVLSECFKAPQAAIKHKA